MISKQSTVDSDFPELCYQNMGCALGRNDALVREQ